MGNPPFEDVSPIKKGGFPIAMLGSQRVAKNRIKSHHRIPWICGFPARLDCQSANPRSRVKTLSFLRPENGIHENPLKNQI